MPITIRPAKHAATLQVWSPGVKTAAQLLNEIHDPANAEDLIQSSFQDIADGPPIHFQQNGFVHTAVEAYSKHLHLVIRPDDVWFAILAQLSIYINAHAEDLRDTFVSHLGQKELEIKDVGSLRTYDFGRMANRMAALMEENLKDPSIRAWIQPDFTTTTQKDVTIASIMMMGAMQKYFSYKCTLTCGLPSVTLLGEKKDWESILQRLDRIQALGEEPRKWYDLLVPVITRFVRTFDSPEDDETVDFWQKIAHYSGGGSGPTYLSGWITAFCFWDRHGACMYTDGYSDINSNEMLDMWGEKTPRLFLSGVPYHRIDSDDVPPGHVSVPVKVDDNGDLCDTMMIAGSFGMEITSSGEPGVAPASRGRQEKELVSESETVPLIGMDTVKPVSGWFIFEVK